MADRGDGIIRWSPNPAREDFLTVDFSYRIVELYKATGQAIPRKFDRELVSKHADIQTITAYDWSPKVRGLVAMGTKGGEVNLLRVDDYSNDSMTLPLKLQRSCQAVAFNTNNFLAVGLDRVRNDQCLQIWDIGQRLASWDSSKKGWQSPPHTEPLYKLEPSVAVSSVKFFHDEPNMLAVGIKNQSVKIHDLRDPNGAVITFQTRCNNNIAIDYGDTNYFASNSLDQPTIMVWDRRATSRQLASKRYLESVENNDIPFGCAMKLDNVIDRRNSTWIRSLRYGRDRPGLMGILSSSGEMQILRVRAENTEDPVEKKLEEGPCLLKIRSSHRIAAAWYDESFGYEKDSRIVSFDWMTTGTDFLQPRVVTRSANQKIDVKLMPTAGQHIELDMLDFSHKSIHPTDFKGQLPKFSKARDSASVLQSLFQLQSQAGASFASPQPPTRPSTTTVQPKPDEMDAQTRVFMFNQLKEIAEALKLDIPALASPTDDSLVSRNVEDSEIMIASTSSISAALKKNMEIWKDIPEDDVFTPEVLMSLSSRQRHEEHHYSIMKCPETPIFSVALQQCLQRIRGGYLYDYKKNQEIVDGDPWLQDVWSWVEGAAEVARSGGMKSGMLDLSYLGVATVWQRELGEFQSARIIGPDQSISMDARWVATVRSIHSRASLEDFAGVDTERPYDRQLCLAICGWGKPIEELNADVKSLVAHGKYTKAAAFALFENRPILAIDTLNKGGKDLLFLALALRLKISGAGALDEQKDQWDFLFASQPQIANDPYLRAIYNYITSGDWTTVINETTLPLRDRTAVALRNLADTELTAWLEKEMATAVEHGDIEGIVLSGITDSFVNLLCKYIDVFNDLQSAVLIVSHAFPLYIQDYRCWAWRREYQDIHNKNKLFIHRAQFDVATTKLSRKRDGTTAIRPSPRQITLRCAHCDEQLTNDLENTAMVAHPTNSSTVIKTLDSNPLYPGNAHSGMVCPKCGKHLPRCTVCLATLGMPRSDRDVMPVDTADKLANFLSFCMKCDHGAHADHSRDWFALHNECPVPECKCRCNEDAPHRE